MTAKMLVHRITFFLLYLQPRPNSSSENYRRKQFIGRVIYGRYAHCLWPPGGRIFFFFLEMNVPRGFVTKIQSNRFFEKKMTIYSNQLEFFFFLTKRYWWRMFNELYGCFGIFLFGTIIKCGPWLTDRNFWIFKSAQNRRRKVFFFLKKKKKKRPNKLS